MRKEQTSRERLERVLGRRAPLFSPTAKRALASAILSVPVAVLAFAIADKGHVASWARLLICPGWTIGLRLVRGEPCGGLLDCVFTALRAAARAAEIIIAVNVLVYGLLIFGIATVLAGMKSRRTN